MTSVFALNKTDVHVLLLVLRTVPAACQNFPWICGNEEKNNCFCWLCIVIGDYSKVMICYFIFDDKLCDICWRVAVL